MSFQAFVLDQLSPRVASVLSPWRPPQWNAPQKTFITASTPATPSASVSTSTTDTLGGQVVGGLPSSGSTSRGTLGTTTVYTFDAVLRLEHQQSLRKTEHPIQTGASLTDHAYMSAARVVLEIGMSDAMDSFDPLAPFFGAASKSVNAYQTLKSLMTKKLPLTLTTRIDTYQNMLIEDIRAPDDVKTLHGLRALVVLSEIFVATTAINIVTARPHQTGATDEGTKVGDPVPPDLQNLLNDMGSPTSDVFHQ